MKRDIRSFSFLMELLFVILFFTLSATICMQVFVKAKQKQSHASELQRELLKASSMAEQLQATQESAMMLFSCDQTDTTSCTIGAIRIVYKDEALTQGHVQVIQEGKPAASLAFVHKGEAYE